MPRSATRRRSHCLIAMIPDSCSPAADHIGSRWIGCVLSIDHRFQVRGLMIPDSWGENPLEATGTGSAVSVDA